MTKAELVIQYISNSYKKSKIEKILNTLKKIESVSISDDGSKYLTATLAMRNYEAAERAKKTIRDDSYFDKYGAEDWKIKVYALEEQSKKKKRDRKSEEKHEKEVYSEDSQSKPKKETDVLKDIPLIPYSFKIFPRIKSVNHLVKAVNPNTIRRIPCSNSEEMKKLTNVRELMVKLPPVEVTETDIYNQWFAYGDVEKIDIIKSDVNKKSDSNKDIQQDDKFQFAFVRFFLIHSAKKMYLNAANIKILGYPVDISFSNFLRGCDVCYDKPTYFLTESTCNTLSAIYLGEYFPSVEESKQFFRKFGSIKAFAEYKTIQNEQAKVVHFVEYEQEQSKEELKGIKKAIFEIQGQKRPIFVEDFHNQYDCIVSLAVEGRNNITVLYNYKQVKSEPAKKVEKKNEIRIPYLPIHRAQPYGYQDYGYFYPPVPIFGNNSRVFKKAKHQKYINPKLLESKQSEEDQKASRQELKARIDFIDRELSLLDKEPTEVGEEDKQHIQNQSENHNIKNNETIENIQKISKSWVSEPLSDNEASK